jgi:hypothetical protein
MKFTALAICLLLFAACSKQEKGEDKVGTAMNSSFSEVIGSDGGYIIQNAQIAAEGEDAIYSIAGACKLVHGTSSVLIVHSKDDANNGNTILALQIPAFAPGTEQEYAGEPGSSIFFVYGLVDDTEWMNETGLVSGSLRFIAEEESDVNLGLNRSVMNGTGEMEIVVSAIDPGQLTIPMEKKYVARFELPMVTLEELVTINSPA